jgi:arylsulfatase
MSGKWHVGSFRPNWPTDRGFDRYYGIISGACNYWAPEPSAQLLDGDAPVAELPADFYTTDYFSRRAAEFVAEADPERPYFLYLAYTAPHWPLHAWPDDIARYRDSYTVGWDVIRERRLQRQKEMGLFPQHLALSPRDPECPPWEQIDRWPDLKGRTFSAQEWDLRMAVYAAMIDRMDQGIGTLLAEIRKRRDPDNTVIMFLSDNGGCAEFLAEDGSLPQPARYGGVSPDGTPVVVGNIPGLRPGGPQTFMSYDLPWANASNTPFRRFKRWTHEGGISTPFILSWPARIREPGIVHSPVHLIDIMPTCLDAAGARHPTERAGQQTIPLEGESMLPAIERREWARERPIVWEHEGSRAVRQGQWKLVSAIGGGWELYDMERDRTELDDLYVRNLSKAQELEKLYDEWAERCGVLPWSVISPDWNPRMRGQSIHLSG